MKKTLGLFASALALSFLAACGESQAATSAAGIYELDKTELEKVMMADMPAEAAGNEMATKMMKQMLEKMEGSIELKADGTAQMMVKMPPMVDQSTEGTWKLDGDNISMTIKDEEGKEETQVATLKDGKITIEQDQGGKKTQMVFCLKTDKK